VYTRGNNSVVWADVPSALPQVVRAEPRHIPLTGHSGAEVMLVQRDNIHFVRKTAGSRAQNARLSEQAAKQRGLVYCGIPFPTVLSSGVDADGRFYFEMEYLTGRTVANIISEAMAFDPAPLMAVLSRLFDFFRLTEGPAISAAAFEEKIVAIAACRTDGAAPYEGKITTMAAHLSALNWHGIPASVCHGDLTLENIMVTERRGLVFIDCDACFASSWWLDAAKLFQDLAGHWCLRDLYLQPVESPALLNATELLSGLAQTSRQMFASLDDDLAERLPQLAALHLFRTVPYATNPQVVGFVLERMVKLLAQRGL